ncbi:MAG: DUF4396 domain-containing protein [Ilumatobacteraceae bacterium]
MLDGAMLMWWVLTVPSFLFVVIDVWRTTPAATVLKWAFVILTAFTGPIGAFFYVLGCREPLHGAHEEYISVRWRQVLGSTMHCAAGDGIGIIVGAAIGGLLALPFWPDFGLEYALGFGFGWAYFQAFAMRDMAGGSYARSLRMTFLPELLSMNLLMAGMQLTSRFSIREIAGGDDPARPEFWFIMSMALVVGFAFAYPINWWLVAHHMKHGMLTVREEPSSAASGSATADVTPAGPTPARPSMRAKLAMTVLTLAILGGTLVVITQFALP